MKKRIFSGPFNMLFQHANGCSAWCDNRGKGIVSLNKAPKFVACIRHIADVSRGRGMRLVVRCAEREVNQRGST